MIIVVEGQRRCEDEWKGRGGRGGLYAVKREREVQEKREIYSGGHSWSMTKERKKNLIKK
jgi:hypothetical protein